MNEETAGRSLTLGGLLESIRLAEEFSQAAFAKKLGVSATHLWDIEKGRKVVSPEHAARFAKVLGRSREQFVRLSLQELVDEAEVKSRPALITSPSSVHRRVPHPDTDVIQSLLPGKHQV
jgi:transcriptional regulator with XRE-family HTH domain